MTKMRKPNMNIVRFTESDVIVASFRLTGMGNGAEDGKFWYGNNSYSVTSTATRAPFYDAFYNGTGISINDMTPVYYNGGGQYPIEGTISSAVDFDTDGEHSYVNGTYYWDGSSFRYKQ